MATNHEKLNRFHRRLALIIVLATILLAVVAFLLPNLSGGGTVHSDPLFGTGNGQLDPDENLEEPGRGPSVINGYLNDPLDISELIDAFDAAIIGVVGKILLGNTP